MRVIPDTHGIRKRLAFDSLSEGVALGLSLLILGVFLMLPLFVNAFQLNFPISFMILAFVGLSFNLCFGFGGIHSFGHAAFYGLGAYMMVISLRFIPNLSIAIVLAISSAILFAVVMSIFASRGRGIFFAIITFAFAQSLYEIVIRSDYVGAQSGLLVPHEFLSPFGVTITNFTNLYYLTLVALLVLLFLMWKVLHSSFGLTLKAIKENQDRARAMGYPVKQIQVVTMGVSAGLTSLAGIFNSFLVLSVGPNLFHWETTLDMLIIVIIGGQSSLFGPIIGAGVLSGLDEILVQFGTLNLVITGAILVAVVIFIPGGLIEVFNKVKRRIDIFEEKSAEDQ